MPLGSSLLPWEPAGARGYTISEAIDYNYEHNPNLPFFTFSRNPGLPSTVITQLEFAKASYRAANEFSRMANATGRPVVGLVASLDAITYHTSIAGLMRAGFIPFPISPRLSAAAIAHLLSKTSCHWILTTFGSLRGLVEGIKAELSQAYPGYELLATEALGFGRLFPNFGSELTEDPGSGAPSPSHQGSWSDVTLYLHSSGSTGFPKAISVSHRGIAEWASYELIKLVRHNPVPITMSGIGLPAFHTLGINTQLLYPVYALVNVAMYPPVDLSKEQPIMPSPDNIVDHMMRTGSNAMITIPAMLHAWAQVPETVDFLKTFSYIGFSGGPISRKVGQHLVDSGVPLKVVYGGTEFGAPNIWKYTHGEEVDQDWEWVEFTDKVSVRWADDGEGRYECQFLACETHHPCVQNMENPIGYATSDLFERHPTRPNLWRIVGRKDDVIMHSSGEKTVPGPMEEIINSSPLIAGVIMFGREHDQAGVLIEPSRSYAIDTSHPTEVATFRNKVWSIIEEANAGAPAFSRIFKEMILVASPSKPLPRTAKGTVMRKRALALYADEITDLYNVVEASRSSQDVTPPEDWTKPTIQSWILEQVQDLVSGRAVDPSADLFDQGFDSLSATFLRLRITGALSSEESLRDAAKSIGQNVVYANPTVDLLTNFVFKLATGDTGEIDRVESIERMIEKYAVGLDPAVPAGSRASPLRDAVVFITGTTGNLGSQLLANLISDSRVRRVYAFNRRSSRSQLLERHKERFEDKGLDVGLLGSAKLTLVQGDLAEERLGLALDLYEELRSSLNLIVHVAWRLDFNLTLPSFEPNVRGTRHLIDLARSCSHTSSLRFLFTSSVATAQSWDQKKGLYPEEILADAGYAVGGGYGEGKYISERLLERSGLNVSCLRIGQVSGGMPQGAWATTDWVPILVKSSLALGALPASTGVVSWIPMDVVCDIIVDIAFLDGPSHRAMNLVHTRPVPWNVVFASIRTAIEKIKPDVQLNLVPMSDWLALLEAKAKGASESSLKTLPAVKLLEFFRATAMASTGGEYDESGGLPSFKTDNAQLASSKMRELTPIGYADAERWIQYWDKHGLFA